eukprot:CAMPEP_0194139982 /NCGR_PEP_ID=MMETSP0152-20130528/9576_1 /TAXON_ID=1049557 /ORGANISM="Thalassiothrix antarctica, Strain L6-D1" /LENGTH=234 /DNA_ID=CAMNT_0038838025 /DNA_START=328 /DNA_END=1032 /DNA_ORIENTATION=-
MFQKQLDLLNAREITTESGCQSAVVLMRHCEKVGTTKDSNGNEHCSVPGLQRAEFIPSLFIGPDSRWPEPSYLYALSTTRQGVHHYNYREIETLKPLATATNLTIDSRFTVGDGPNLANEIFDQLVDGSLCGKTTLICWKHSDIPQMARALGCGTKSGCPNTYPKYNFDQVWIINFFYDIRNQYIRALTKQDDVENQGSARFLKNKQKKKWDVFGFVTEFGFDPLHFQKQQGIY